MGSRVGRLRHMLARLAAATTHQPWLWLWGLDAVLVAVLGQDPPRVPGYGALLLAATVPYYIGLGCCIFGLGWELSVIARALYRRVKGQPQRPPPPLPWYLRIGSFWLGGAIVGSFF